MGNWVSIKESLPEDDNQLCLFAQFDDNQSSDSLVLSTDYMSWRSIKIFRAYDLAHRYTHWMAIDRPKRLKK